MKYGLECFLIVRKLLRCSFKGFGLLIKEIKFHPLFLSRSYIFVFVKDYFHILGIISILY